MQKQLINKKIILGICAVVIVAMAATVMLVFGREEAYRSILVYELEGSAVIDRAQIGAIDAAENLYLESGDRVSVEADSMMRMKLDDDKYITAEENTVFSLEAAGSDRDSKTKIHLEQGAVTNEIQNPLSSGSEYETATPNSVMAVRGTIYRVEMISDENGGENTRVCCFEGTVGATPILPDGTMGEEVLVPAGSELTVYSDGTMTEPKEIDYISLSVQALKTLDDILENGASIEGMTRDELSSLIAEISAQTAQSAEDETELAAQTEEAPDADDMGAGADGVSGAAEGSAKLGEKGSVDSGNSGGKNQRSQNGTGSGNGSERDRKDKDEENSETQKPQDQAAVTGNTSGASGDVSQSDGSQEQSSDDNDSADGADDEKRDDSDSQSKKPSKTKTYTVTYEYQGSVFATQTVKSGETATAPKLLPAQSGGWDFDFSKKIEANTTIQWK